MGADRDTGSERAHDRDHLLRPLNYEPRAVGAADDLLANYQHVIASLTLSNGTGGIFDVVVDGDLLYSKHATGRHAEPGEVLALFEDTYARDVPRYGT